MAVTLAHSTPHQTHNVPFSCQALDEIDGVLGGPRKSGKVAGPLVHGLRRKRAEVLETMERLGIGVGLGWNGRGKA